MTDARSLLIAFFAALVFVFSGDIACAVRNLIWAMRVVRLCRREPVVVILHYGHGARSALSGVRRVDVSQPDGWRAFVASDGKALRVGVRPPAAPEEVIVTLEGEP